MSKSSEEPEEIILPEEGTQLDEIELNDDQEMDEKLGYQEADIKKAIEHF
jgi:hypothetical protein